MILDTSLWPEALLPLRVVKVFSHEERNEPLGLNVSQGIG